MTRAASPNCIDIVAPLIEELGDRELLDGFQLMGGIGSAALKHSGTVILPDERRIVTSMGFLEDNPDLDVMRPNGTLRDIDALVLTDDPERLAEVERVTTDVIGDQLEISVFGLRPYDHLVEQMAKPFGLKSLKTFVSDRYVLGDGRISKALTPFAVELDPESLTSWTAEINGSEFPIVNPATALQNYLSRSISGLRPKDFDKVQKMASHLTNRWPDMQEWMIYGPGRPQMELAGILQTLRRSNSRPKDRRVLDVGGITIAAGNVRDLKHHDAFLYKHSDPDIQKATLALAAAKARGLGIPESNETIVKLFQMFAEQRLDTITKNK